MAETVNEELAFEISAEERDRAQGYTTYTDEDGFTWEVDLDTGERLNVLAGPERDEEFRVRDEDSLDWVLAKMLHADSLISEVEGSAAVLAAKAVLANAAKMTKERQRKRDWLEARFGPEILDYLLHATEGKKSRSVKTVHGTAGLRKSAAKVKVADPAAALGMAKIFYPDAIKVSESFLISMLTKEQVADLQAGLAPDKWSEDDEARKAFVLEPETDKLKITTGVE